VPIGAVSTSAAATPMRAPRTRLQKGIKNPKVYTDGTLRYGLLTSTGEPRNLDDALSDCNWRKAMEDEYSALMQNKTWHLVPSSPNKNVIDCNGSIVLRKMQMVHLTGTRLGLLQKVSNNAMVLTMKILLVPLLKQLLSDCIVYLSFSGMADTSQTYL
jgi:hypothetical protein